MAKFIKTEEEKPRGYGDLEYPGRKDARWVRKQPDHLETIFVSQKKDGYYVAYQEAVRFDRQFREIDPDGEWTWIRVKIIGWNPENNKQSNKRFSTVSQAKDWAENFVNQVGHSEVNV